MNWLTYKSKWTANWTGWLDWQQIEVIGLKIKLIGLTDWIDWLEIQVKWIHLDLQIGLIDLLTYSKWSENCLTYKLNWLTYKLNLIGLDYILTLNWLTAKSNWRVKFTRLQNWIDYKLKVKSMHLRWIGLGISQS